jgi:hypothetical protein
MIDARALCACAHSALRLFVLSYVFLQVPSTALRATHSVPVVSNVQVVLMMQETTVVLV